MNDVMTYNYERRDPKEIPAAVSFAAILHLPNISRDLVIAEKIPRTTLVGLGPE